MLQQEKPGDYVMATGVTTTVRDFTGMAFREAGIELEWKGAGVDEKGLDKKTGKTVVEVDPRYFRPTEVDLLIGDPSKAMRELGWKPRVDLAGLVKMMVEADLKDAEREVHLRDGGFETRNRFE